MKKMSSRILSSALSLLLVALLVIQAPSVAACSSVELESSEGDPYWFRTCDMDDSYNVFGENGSYIESSYLVSYPAGVPIDFTLGEVVPDHTVVGMSFSNSLAMLDGVNDAGLICGLLHFDEGTQIPVEEIPEDGRPLAAMEAVTWFLAQCANVEEVRALAEETYVNAAYVEGVLGSDYAATLHLSFVDAEGNCIVLEADDPERPGRFSVYESNGVMTNSPTYPEQLELLNQYVANSPELRSQGITELEMENVVSKGEASADQVLPASYASRDRFVHLSVLRYLADGGNKISNKDMLVQGNYIINGVRALNDNGKGAYYYDHVDENGEVQGASPCYTQYVVCYDSARRSLAIQPYDSTVWTTLSVEEVPTDARATYEIHRGPEGSTISALSVGAQPEAENSPATEDAPVASTTNVWMYGAIALGVVVVILAVLLVRKKNTDA